MFRPDWYRDEGPAGLVRDYYWLLRSLLRAMPEARRYRCRCRHCGIFFLSDPRNAGREDLGCPFGCREAHRKAESTRRSVDYYGTPEGRIKKRLQNSKRASERSEHSRGPETSSLAGDEPENLVVAADVTAAEDQNPPLDHVRWSEALIEYVRWVSSLIEGRRVKRWEVLEMLSEVLRQHSMVRRRRVDHLVAHLHQQPP